MAGAAHDGGEDGPGRVVAGESSLAHAGAIVNNQSSNFVVTHLVSAAMKCFRGIFLIKISYLKFTATRSCDGYGTSGEGVLVGLNIKCAAQHCLARCPPWR